MSRPYVTHEAGHTLRRPGRGLLFGASLLAAIVASGTGAAVLHGAASPPVTGIGAKLVAQARAAGTFTFYTAADPVTAQNLADAFSKKYGIKTTFTRLTAGPIEARYTAEAQAGKPSADAVLLSDPGFFARSVADHWMVPLTARQAPNWAVLPKKFRFFGAAAVGVTRLNNFIYNTNRVSAQDAPTTWKGLLSPKFKGRILAADPRSSPVGMGEWQMLRIKFGDDFVRQLGQQQIRFVPSMVAGTQTVAAGDQDVAIFGAQLFLTPLFAAAPSAPAKMVHVESPDFGFIWAVGASANSPNPAAGLLFVNWLISGQGQVLFNTPTGSNSVLTGAKIAGTTPLTSKFITLSTSVSPSNQSKILSLLGLG